MRSAPRLLLILLPCLSACPDGEGVDAGPQPCPIGDLNQPVEMQVVHRTVDGGLEPTGENALVPLIEPPQGGRVIFVGVRARNLDACSAFLVASLRDACTGQLIGVERRPVLLEPAGDGWAQPKQPVEISNYANLPLCPTPSVANKDVEGELYRLEVKISDGANRSAQASLQIEPYCAEPQTLDRCLCLCDVDYVLGAACPADVDSGVPLGSCPPDAGM